jgi:hypothetical protein
VAVLGWEAALAIYAAVLSSLLGAVQLIEFLRKRPRLTLTLRAELDQQGGRNEARLVLDVANDPHGVPVTVMKVGALISPDAPRLAPPSIGPGWALDPKPEIELILSTAGGLPVLVEPGHSVRLIRPLDATPLPVHVDAPLRAFLVDSRGDRTWAETGYAPERSLMNLGWNPPVVVTSDLTAPRSNLRLPLAAPRWHVWRPNRLRSTEPFEPQDATRLLVDRTP